MKFGVVLFPSKKLQDVANSYRKRYDSHYSLIPPHLTLKEVFEATEDQIDEVAANLRKIAEETNPFTLNVTKVSSFSPANNVIYLKVEQKQELTSLYNKLHEGNLEQPTEYSFIPHITIGQRLSDDEHLDVYSQLKLVDVAHEETVDRFHLMYQLENETWTVFETFRLGKG
ncbi:MULTISPECIES: YjcG family protein [Priestia]|jgi:2'-5' RNA ligase|uniref:YjcG family protein n=1 Tax=Priestia TaxID=2800373 RepID=UPI0008E259A9|nr:MULTISPECIES: YjcG family protein [Priestia]MBY0094150.1 2'-5' RNA ligase family protein [Priestia aryabhattai]MBY0101791.1 2'-5' RNA ligase family protein [Priestia aryabhattai]MCM3094696.1 YjcG family protein [Priestia megaterium]MCM3307330.1 YjcG family protein [Priestia megaterium]MDM8147458.1 YjcG family protein [Priestia megaterium]